MVRPAMVKLGDSEPVGVQVLPPSREYWYDVIAAPPFEPGVKETPRAPFSGVTAVMTGGGLLVRQSRLGRVCVGR